MDYHWIIDAADADKRLDIFLTEQLPSLTRSAIAKRIKAEKALVNGKARSVHHFLKTGDAVDFSDTEPAKPRAAARATAATTTASLEALPPLVILEETPDWLVIDKPAGLLVHTDSAHLNTPSLVDLLVKHVPGIEKIGEDPERPGIVHRLDREVSGLMVVAKTQAAFDTLKQQFASHSVDKTYLALVHGELPQDEGDIKFRIARSTSKARMAARPENEKGGKAAWTHYKVLERYVGATLCELTILSGRTHQIRAHMHGLGSPVMGDPLYTLRQTDRKLQPPRLLLQSIRLSFLDPATSERKTFTLAPDPAFAHTIDLLKN